MKPKCTASTDAEWSMGSKQRAHFPNTSFLKRALDNSNWEMKAGEWRQFEKSRRRSNYEVKYWVSDEALAPGASTNMGILLLFVFFSLLSLFTFFFFFGLSQPLHLKERESTTI